MKTTSLDLRKRILAAYDTGQETRVSVAKRFCVSLGLVKKLIQQRRHLGDIAPLHWRAGRKPLFTEAHKDQLRATIRRQPDTTLAEFRELLGLDCSLVSIHRVLVRMGMTYKKNASGQRAGPPGHPGSAGKMGREDKGMGAGSPRVHRRIGGQDQHDPFPGARPERRPRL